jgi:hypothetical protein
LIETPALLARSGSTDLSETASGPSRPGRFLAELTASKEARSVQYADPVSIATSIETVAFVAAGAALFGGVLGAIAGGLSEYFLERHRSRTKARAGARLVRSELLTAAEQMWIVEQGSKWKLWFDFSMKTWDAYRDSLAAALKPEPWGTVDEAVRGVRGLGIGIDRLDRYGMPTTTTEPALEANSVRALTAQRRRVRSAYDALALLAKGAKASGEFGKGRRAVS